MSVLKSVQIHKVHTNVHVILDSRKMALCVMISMNAQREITADASKFAKIQLEALRATVLKDTKWLVETVSKLMFASMQNVPMNVSI